MNLTRRPFDVLRPEIENIRMRNATPPAGFVDRPSFLVTLAALGEKPLDPESMPRIGQMARGRALGDNEARSVVGDV